ncbi:MAG TPA: hypothetical protein VFH40_01485 [Gemmatimonadales bacterium]|nr:hypothetical protein [Gemmatimonadales bacterium]
MSIYRTALAATAVFIPLLPVQAQEPHAGHHPPARDTMAVTDTMSTDSLPTDSMGAMMPERPFGIPMTRMGSGTAWLPDASAMRAWHFTAGGWMLMVHGDAFLQYDHQGGPRGADQAGSINWGMLMAMRQVSGGTLHLHGMMSAEPLTIGEGGYPLLLQSGETYRGAPLHDRQHPHDLFMELSALYERAISRRVGVMLYVAPVGEPGIGPVAYMHRPSALNDPFAPLGHHWTDATHITYGVLTAGVSTKRFKLEGTLFNGREPDEDRYDFDFHALESYGARLSVNPTPHLAVSASYGYLKHPEALHPEDNQHRLGASVLHTVRLGRQGEWASALVYGANKHVESTGVTGPWDHSLMAESNLQLDAANTVFGRVEYVRKSGEELALQGPLAAEEFDIGNLSLGYVREFGRYRGATFGIGARGAINLVPGSLEPVYGSRTPVGLVVFLRVRPALLEGAHTMDPEIHHGGAEQHTMHRLER